MPSIDSLGWASTGRSAIFSIDFHPDGTRFAIAQGMSRYIINDCHVYIIQCAR